MLDGTPQTLFAPPQFARSELEQRYIRAAFNALASNNLEVEVDGVAAELMRIERSSGALSAALLDLSAKERFELLAHFAGIQGAPITVLLARSILSAPGGSELVRGYFADRNSLSGILAGFVASAVPVRDVRLGEAVAGALTELMRTHSNASHIESRLGFLAMAVARCGWSNGADALAAALRWRRTDAQADRSGPLFAALTYEGASSETFGEALIEIADNRSVDEAQRILAILALGVHRIVSATDALEDLMMEASASDGISQAAQWSLSCVNDDPPPFHSLAYTLRETECGETIRKWIVRYGNDGLPSPLYDLIQDEIGADIFCGTPYELVEMERQAREAIEDEEFYLKPPHLLAHAVLVHIRDEAIMSEERFVEIVRFLNPLKNGAVVEDVTCGLVEELATGSFPEDPASKKALLDLCDEFGAVASPLLVHVLPIASAPNTAMQSYGIRALGCLGVDGQQALVALAFHEDCGTRGLALNVIAYSSPFVFDKREIFRRVVTEFEWQTFGDAAMFLKKSYGRGLAMWIRARVDLAKATIYGGIRQSLADAQRVFSKE